MINLLFIGYGSISIKHISNLQKIKKKIHFFILSRKKKLILKNTAKSNITHLKSLKNIKNKKISKIFICNGSNEHLRYLNLTKNISKYIFIEKPLSDNLSKFKNIKLKNFKSHKIQIGYNFLFLKIIKFLKNYLNNSKEKIIKVSIKAGYYLPYWRKNIDYKDSVTAKKKLGGGALLELSHEISYVLWLFGRPTHVTGLIQKNSELKMNTEDVVYINLIYKEFICSIELDVVSKSYDRYCKIDTDKNSYFWEYKKNSILKKNKNKVKKIYKKKFNLNESYLEEIKYFVGSKKKFSNITLKNSIDTLSIISSIRKSSVKKSSKIKIKYEN